MSDSPATPAVVDAANPVPVVETGFKVFAGNLAYATDETQLRQFFGSFASDILAVQLMQRPFRHPGNAGYGFVTFNTEEAADKAITALDKQELEGRPVVVERAKPIDLTKERKPRRKFNGRRGSKSVPGEANEPRIDDQGAHADGVAPVTDGEGTRKRKKRNTKKKSKKPAADGAVTEGEADAAPVHAEGEAVDGEEKVKKPRKPKAPRRPRPERGPGEPSKTVLFVANLAFSVDETQLTEFFAANGITIQSARVVRRPFGIKKSKGYAFVDVGDEEEQKKAIEAVQGKPIADREVTVKIAVDRPFLDKDVADAAAEHAEVADAPAPAAAPVAPAAA